ncbi:MAG: hypothetical protein AAF667_16185 [Pseudomonadota bacterium]
MASPIYKRHGLIALLGAGTLLGPLITGGQAGAQEFRFAPQLTIEATGYANDPQFPGQVSDATGALIFTGDLTWRSDDRSLQFVLEPYLRLDEQDNERTYGDLRRGFVRYFGDVWDVTIGADRVFWGVVESVNVVDVINQRDALENPDLDEKLGQPMIRFAALTGIGTFEVYYMPTFREREFVGLESRNRLPAPVNSSAALFDREDGSNADDFALRYSNTFGSVDLGVSYFYGTSRAPLLSFDGASGTFIPRYQRLRQIGADLQYTAGAWLWKLEATETEIAADSFNSAVGGLEYTFFDVAGSGRDVGLIAEYLYDGRTTGLSPATPFDDDVFLGTRITWNDVQDTEFLAGVIIDRDTNAAQFSIEFERRIGENNLLELEFRGVDAQGDPLLTAFEDDTALTLRWSRFF